MELEVRRERRMGEGGREEGRGGMESIIKLRSGGGTGSLEVGQSSSQADTVILHHSLTLTADKYEDGKKDKNISYSSNLPTLKNSVQYKCNNIVYFCSTYTQNK